MQIVELDTPDVDGLIAFVERLPVGDRTFIKEDVTDADTVRSWERALGERWVARHDGRVVGYLAVLGLAGWSDHVAEIRLVVDPARRGQGVGRALARHALREALLGGYRKVIVELVADQQSALTMFTDLGFTGEALLRDHILDRDGQLRDLIMLAHYIEETYASMQAFGLADELA